MSKFIGSVDEVTSLVAALHRTVGNAPHSTGAGKEVVSQPKELKDPTLGIVRLDDGELVRRTGRRKT